LPSIEAVARWVAKYAWRAIEEGMVPLVMGGDHSLAIGSIAASAQSVFGLGVIWLDAHPDFNTPETSPTGNLHGMALAIAAGWGPAPLVRLNGTAPMVHPERIVIIGARSVDAGETSNLRRAGVRVYDSEYIERFGVQSTVEEAVAYLAKRNVRALHLSVDIDVLDPSNWPGVSTPAQGGMTAQDLRVAARTIAELAPIAAMDLVELTPGEDAAGATVTAALDVAESALAPRVRARAGAVDRGDVDSSRTLPG
jgi:arginase